MFVFRQNMCMIFNFSLPFSIARKTYFAYFAFFPNPVAENSSTRNQLPASHNKSIIENLLSVFEKPQEEVIDEQKLRHLASKKAIWDHFGIPQDHYLALYKNQETKMLNEYYNKLLPFYFKNGKSYIFFSLDSGFFFNFEPWPVFGWCLKILFCVFSASNSRLVFKLTKEFLL